MNRRGSMLYSVDIDGSLSVWLSNLFSILVFRKQHMTYIHASIYMGTLNIKRKEEICVQQKRYMPQPATQPTSQNMHANTFRFLRGKAAKRTKINYSTGIVRAATAALKRKKKKKSACDTNRMRFEHFSLVYIFHFFSLIQTCAKIMCNAKRQMLVCHAKIMMLVSTLFYGCWQHFTSSVRVCVYNLRMRCMKKKNHSVNKA